MTDKNNYGQNGSHNTLNYHQKFNNIHHQNIYY
jgi:hypothetical protein